MYGEIKEEDFELLLKELKQNQAVLGFPRDNQNRLRLKVLLVHQVSNLRVLHRTVDPVTKKLSLLDDKVFLDYRFAHVDVYREYLAKVGARILNRFNELFEQSIIAEGKQQREQTPKIVTYQSKESLTQREYTHVKFESDFQERVVELALTELQTEITNKFVRKYPGPANKVREYNSRKLLDDVKANAQALKLERQTKRTSSTDSGGWSADESVFYT